MPPVPPDAAAVAEALDACDAARRAALSAGRSDLARRVERSASRLAHPAVRVLVVGEFKTGKSTLVNRLVGIEVCPVDDDVATTVPTVIHAGAGDGIRAAALYPGAADSPPDREEITLDEARALMTGENAPVPVGDADRAPLAVELAVPGAPLLDAGIVLCDTPGAGGLGSPHMATTIGALPLTEAVLFVTDAAQELTAPESSFLETARKLCPDVYCVLTKTDFHVHWRRVAELDRGHLRRMGLTHPDVYPMSSALAAYADTHGDTVALAESGLADLERVLRERILGASLALRLRGAVADATSVVDQLESRYSGEREALADPERATGLIGDLREAESRAEELRSGNARWHQSLNDGITDLASQVDFDLRARLRNLGREADEVVEGCDPADTWDEVEAWIRHRATESVTDNYAVLRSLADDLANRVDSHFGSGEAEVSANLHIEAPVAGISVLDVPSPAVTETFKLASAAIHGARFAYGGVLMTGMVGMAVLGVPLLNPVTIVVGLLLGRKAVRDEKKRQLGIRRQQAKTSARRFLDDVSFHAAADSRAVIRNTHRDLRDLFASRAEELTRSAGDALRAAQAAASADASERPDQLRRAEASLAETREIGARLRSLAESHGFARERSP